MHVQPMPSLNNILRMERQKTMKALAEHAMALSIAKASLNGQPQHEPSGTKAWVTSPNLDKM